MALSFDEPVSADFSVRPFAIRAEENADGWGLAWYPDRAAALVKEPLSWRESQYAKFLEDYSNLQSQTYIAHVRKRTVGADPTHADTHPFLRELNGREYCFAHNGTVAGAFDELPLGAFRPLGDTDSEHVFCHLLECLRCGPGELESPASWRWLFKKLRELNTGGKLNVLLSDGVRLFCYFDLGGWKGLHYHRLGVHENGDTEELQDRTMHIGFKGAPGGRGVVVASRPLSKGGWRSFRRGELIVLQNGRMRFSSQRSDYALPAPSRRRNGRASPGKAPTTASERYASISAEESR